MRGDAGPKSLFMLLLKISMFMRVPCLWEPVSLYSFLKIKTSLRVFPSCYLDVELPTLILLYSDCKPKNIESRAMSMFI